MPGTPGPRTGLAAINPTGEMPSLLRTTINAVISWLEGNAMLTSAGLLSARPVSTPSTPGISGRRYYATDTGVEYRDTGTGWIALGIELVTSLPTSPFNGQIVDYLADATNGVIWRLRYRSASTSAYKWEFVGGAQLAASNTSSGTRAVGAGYGGLTGTTGPSIVAPLAGDYEISFGARHQNNNAGAVAATGVQIGAATVTDDDAAVGMDDGGSPVSVWRSIRRTVTASATTVQTVFKSSSGTATFSELELRVRPVRVG